MGQIEGALRSVIAMIQGFRASFQNTKYDAGFETKYRLSRQSEYVKSPNGIGVLKRTLLN